MTVMVVIEFVDGGRAEYEEELGIVAKHDRLAHTGKVGKALIDELIGDDWAAPPRKVTISFLGHGKREEIVLHAV